MYQGQPPTLTEEEKERLGVARKNVFNRWKILGICSIIISVVAIGLGIAQMTMSEHFPYSMGLPMYAGGMVYMYIIMGAFAFTVDILGFAMSGIWGLAECTSEQSFTDSCTPDRDGLLAVSVLSAIVCLLLIVLNIIGSCVYCCNSRALGIISRYDEIRIAQEQRQAGFRRIGAQPAFPPAPEGYMYQLVPTPNRGGPPVQGPYYQGPVEPSAYRGPVQPSAPPAMPEGAQGPARFEQESDKKDIHFHRGVDESLPPSYEEVMK